jgi:predicted amidophosphoribosyltransferase
MSICKKCGAKIKPPFKYCDECNDEIAKARGQLMRCGRKAETRLKAAADASGNSKVWRAGEFSQDFLRSLIPQR